MERPQRASKRLKSARSAMTNANDTSGAVDDVTNEIAQPRFDQLSEKSTKSTSSSSEKSSKTLTWTPEMITALFTTLLKEKKAGRWPETPNSGITMETTPFTKEAWETALEAFKAK
jgi:hypothetical protein